MKASNANKVISVLLSVAMCPMMVPSAAFAAEDDAASGASSPNEQTQPADQAEGVDAGASSSDTIAPQSEATGEAADASTGEAAAPVEGANEEGAEAPTAEEGTEAAVAEVNGTNYPSLQAAIDAAKERAVVKLLADTKENVTISTKNVTLDLNGHTLNGGTEKGKPALTVTARVTVMDSSAAQTGTIMREDTAENSGISSHYVIDVQGGKSGWLFFQSGNVKNDSGAGGTKGASLVRVGDDSKPGLPHMTITGGTFTQNNFIVLKCDSGILSVAGGTINSANSSAIHNWKTTDIKDGDHGASRPVINGNVSTWTYNGSGSSLEISGGTVNGNVESVTYDGVEGNPAKVSITGGVVKGTLNTVDYSTGTTSNDPAKATIEVTGGTFSTDPSRYLIEGSAATPNGDGTFGVAKAYLAQVGETSYYTMGEAFDAQTKTGKAITLLRDYTTGSTFNSGTETRVVDLNGHTWTCTGTDANSAAFEINYSNASLTVKNGKIVSSQLIGLIPSAMGGTIKYDNSTLTFEGVEATTTATSGIETNGNNANDTVVLKDSTLNVPNGFGIYFPSSGTLTIDNSTINAKTMGAQVCSGNLNVTAGSAITVSGDPVKKLEGDGAIQDGAAISIVNRPGYKGLDQIAITGGTFTAKAGNAALKAYTWDSATKQESTFDNSAKTVAVFGGTFSSAVASDLCAEGYALVANADGTYSVGVPVAQIGGNVFTSLQAAIDAAQAGDTVQLIADAVVDATVVVQDKDAITLDLNGKTISNTKEIWNEAVYNWSLISVRGNSDLTITGNGAVDALANDSYAIDLQGAASKCTIENGTFTGNISAVYIYDGALTINGGTFDIKQLSGQGDHRFTINCYDSNYKNGTAQVSINGGTFNGFDPANNLAEGTGTAFTAPGYTSVANADGTYSVAAGVAQVAGKAFTSLQAAIDAAQNGETVTLLTDTTEDATIAAGKNITLNLGGKTLTNTNTGKATLTIAKGATATVKNGSIVGGTGYYTIDNYGTATLEDVTATAGNTDSSMIRNDGTLTIESGSYSGGLNVVKSEEDSTLTINGGKFELSYATNGYTGVVFAYGNTTITGGEFIQSLTTTGRWNHPQVIATGVVEGHTAITRVTGGHFVNKMSGEGIFRGVGKGTSDNFEVSGGTFNKSISEEYCADGFIPTKNADGTYGVKEGHYVAQIGDKKYETLAKAISLAAKGKTIQLLTDATENITIAANKQITLDLNGYTLNGDTGTAKATILNEGTVTITDTSAGKTGTIKRDDQGIEGETSYYVIDNNGTMVIDQANVVNNSGIKGSSLIRNGGVDTVSSLTINGGTFEQQNFIAVKNDGNGELTINGGTLTSKQAVVQNWNKAQILGGNLTGGYLWTDSYTEAGTIGETVIGGDAQFTGTIYMDVTSPNPSTLKIEGGKLDVTKWTVTSAAAAVNASIAVSGGTFTAAVPENYCAAGYIPTTNSDGTYSVKEGTFVAKVDNVKYDSLQEAIDAAKDNSTVRLLADVTLTKTVVFPAGKKVNLNLVGHNITATDTALRINGTTDIQDTPKTGTIESTGRVAVEVGDNAKVTVYSGTLKGREGAVVTGKSTGATIEVRGSKTTLIAPITLSLLATAAPVRASPTRFSSRAAPSSAASSPRATSPAVSTLRGMTISPSAAVPSTSPMAPASLPELVP
ncbi:beta strand repeat-containing protein [Ellagibacter isourolithinifaciens]|uniref:beta strand repeat-containing protein n=1 Tax=Ellagibacter isourolithinifaciens TaxID=2137581 RepID=UPI003A904CF9